MIRVKRWSPIVICALCVVAIFVSSCSKRRSVSDSELAQIFHDAFLTNAYSSRLGLNLDSLRLYEPIFHKYGYTTDDVQYAIGSFATRKSARLGDVVERAISMLEAEGVMLDREVAILDTIDNIAQRYASELIYSDSIIMMRSWSDTSHMTIIFDPIESGNYTINFDYRVDSLNSVDNLRLLTWFEVQSSYDSIAQEPKYKVTNRSSLPLSSDGVKHMSRSIKVDEKHERLYIKFAHTDKIDTKKTPSITIKEFSVKKNPTTKESHEIIFDRLVPIKLFNNEFFAQIPKDSI